MADLLQRLKQRKLVQWALAYAAGGWIVLQVLSLVAGTYDWPPSAMRIAVVVVALGFPVVLVLAWYHGERGAQRISGTELLILALLLAIGGLVMWRVVPRAERGSGPLSSATRGQASAFRPESDSDPLSLARKSIAVLPFENLSDDKANAYFASGMQDMILTKLAAIGELKVISRTSTEKYASHPEDLKIIAQQLGVGTILEGSVQKSGNEVLINVQLVDAGNDRHLWAEAYPRTLDNVFGVEGEVAQKIADALKTHLNPAESARVARLPTRDKAAYDAFLKAEYEHLQAQASWNQAAFLAADADYENAIAHDPAFALAYARLGYCRMRRHWFATPLTDAELRTVKTAIERALALAPELPEAHLALGYYLYWGFRRYDEAIAEFERTLKLAPNSADALAGLAFIARRTGLWQKSLDDMDQALLVSPRDAQLRGEQGASLVYLRRYADAERQIRLALEIDPDNANAKDQLQLVRLFGFGDAQGARDAYRSPPGWRIVAQEVSGGDVINLIDPHAYPDVFDRRFDTALKAWDAAPAGTAQERRIGKVARIAIRVIAGQRASARVECERIAPELQRELAQRPDALGLLQQTSWLDLCLGRNAEALAAAQRAVELMPLEKDAYNYGANALVGLAQVAAQAGAADAALPAIERLLSIPAGGVMSIERLKLDPVWDPLREDPRFQALLKADAAGDGRAHDRAPAAPLRERKMVQWALGHTADAFALRQAFQLVSPVWCRA